jgi:hypothetical protein
MALLAACGGRGGYGGDARVDDDARAERPDGRAEDGGVDDGGGGPDDGGPSFAVEVVGGYGSGTYRPGSTVHIWSAVSTTDEVSLGWTGDAVRLDAADEWRTRFVMPARDVRWVSERAARSVSLEIETFNGGTSRPKTVRYHFPPRMRGVVLFSHGTGGSSNFIENTEAFALALALVHSGYGVISTEAEEAVAGDLNGDGKERWSSTAAALRADNVDLRNLELLFERFEARGLVPAATPKFALGMSNGGAMSHFLGVVGASPVAAEFPRLRFRAVVSYCADATATRSAAMSVTPSAWFMCGADDNPEVSNVEARANERALSARGVPTDYLENPPSPLYDARFTRVAGISVETSRAMASELRSAGLVDPAGFLNRNSEDIVQLVMAGPTMFPTIVRQAGALGAIRGQIKAMRAEHQMYADFTRRNIAFFDRFNTAP